MQMKNKLDHILKKKLFLERMLRVKVRSFISALKNL